MFQDYKVHLTAQNTTRKRGRAGVSVLTKNKHSDLLAHIKSASQNIIWNRLKGHLFGIESDIYQAAVYLPPLQSQRKLNRRRRPKRFRTIKTQIFHKRPKREKIPENES